MKQRRPSFLRACPGHTTPAPDARPPRPLAKRPRRLPGACLLLLLLTCLALGVAAPSGAQGPVRAIYVEGGPYGDYDMVLQGLILGLRQRGLLPDVPAQGTSRESWRRLAALSSATDGTLQFLPDGFYSADWSDEDRKRNKAAILQRIRERGDVDLILAMGTWAGVDMATDEHAVPVMALSASDAHGAGIMKTPLDSGRDHVYAMIEPDRLPRQVVFFHKIFRFNRLGITYEDTPDGRSAAGIDMIREVAALLDITLVPCTAAFDVPDVAVTHARLLACHEELAPRVDAMYLTVNNALTAEAAPELAEPFHARGIPTFAQHVPGGVRQGILLDIAQASPDKEGLFAANALAMILAGASPRKAPNWFENEISISLNMDTARRIGWTPPFSLLLAVDKLYAGGKEHRGR